MLPRVQGLPEPLLDRMIEDGRAAWPGVDVSKDRFAEHVCARLTEGADPASLHAADLYLACACETGDARALAAFEARFAPEIPLYLAGVERSAAAIEEVRQLVRERLFVAPSGRRPKIAEYSGRGSLGSWVRVVTLRVASNRRRTEKPHEDLDAASEAKVLPLVDPELAILRARYRPVFDEALRAAFADLAPRERTLLRMHYVDGVPLDRLGLVFNVHRATVARWLASARESVLDRTIALVRDRLNVSAAELESLLPVLRSGFTLSLRALLSERAESA